MTARATLDDPAYLTMEDVATQLRLGLRTLQRIIHADEAKKFPELRNTYHKIGRRRLWTSQGVDDLASLLDRRDSRSNRRVAAGTPTEQSGLETSQDACDEVLALQRRGRGRKRKLRRAPSKRRSSTSSSTASSDRRPSPTLVSVT